MFNIKRRWICQHPELNSVYNINSNIHYPSVSNCWTIFSLCCSFSKGIIDTLDVRKNGFEIVTRAQKVKLLGSQVMPLCLSHALNPMKHKATRQNKMVKVDVYTLFFRTHVPIYRLFILTSQSFPISILMLSSFTSN